jgi:formylglycine-generating enzyme
VWQRYCLTLGVATLYLSRVSDLRRAFVLSACLFGCGQAQAPHSAPAPVPPATTAFSSATHDTSFNAAVSAAPTPACPSGMARVAGYCIDRYEAYVVELDANDHEFPHSPYTPVDGLRVRAKVAEGVVPQGYISQVQASRACLNAGKRLCSAPEFSLACRGPDPKASYPYGGKHHQAGKCNEGKGSAVSVVFGQQANYGSSELNDPRLNQWAGGLAKTGAYTASVSPFGVFDLVGNLHEWSAEVGANGHGYFRGGFYGDAELNGSGCDYVTKAHAVNYHDYSTGFRCCQDDALRDPRRGAATGSEPE